VTRPSGGKRPILRQAALLKSKARQSKKKNKVVPTSLPTPGKSAISETADAEGDSHEPFKDIQQQRPGGPTSKMPGSVGGKFEKSPAKGQGKPGADPNRTHGLVQRVFDLCDRLGVDDFSIKLMITATDDLATGAKTAKSNNTRRSVWSSLVTKVLVHDLVSGRIMLLGPPDVHAICDVLERERDNLYDAIDSNGPVYTVPMEHHPGSLMLAATNEVGFTSMFAMEMTMMMKTEEEDKVRMLKQNYAPFGTVGSVCIYFTPLSGATEGANMEDITDPDQLLGKPWAYTIHIQVVSVQSELECRQMFCEFEFWGDHYKTDVQETGGRLNFHTEITVVNDCVEGAFLDYLRNVPVKIMFRGTTAPGEIARKALVSASPMIRARRKGREDRHAFAKLIPGVLSGGGSLLSKLRAAGGSTEEEEQDAAATTLQRMTRKKKQAQSVAAAPKAKQPAVTAASRVAAVTHQAAEEGEAAVKLQSKMRQSFAKRKSVKMAQHLYDDVENHVETDESDDEDQAFVVVQSRAPSGEGTEIPAQAGATQPDVTAQPTPADDAAETGQSSAPSGEATEIPAQAGATAQPAPADATEAGQVSAAALVTKAFQLCDKMGVEDLTLKLIMTMSDQTAAKPSTKRNLWKSLESKILVANASGCSALLTVAQMEALCPIMEQELGHLHAAIDQGGEPYAVPSDRLPASLFFSQTSEVGFSSVFLMETTMMLETDEEDKMTEQPIRATFAPFETVGQMLIAYSPATGPSGGKRRASLCEIENSTELVGKPWAYNICIDVVSVTPMLLCSAMQVEFELYGKHYVTESAAVGPKGELSTAITIHVDEVTAGFLDYLAHQPVKLIFKGTPKATVAPKPVRSSDPLVIARKKTLDMGFANLVATGSTKKAKGPSKRFGASNLLGMLKKKDNKVADLSTATPLVPG
jgi:hypothetical protein